MAFRWSRRSKVPDGSERGFRSTLPAETSPHYGRRRGVTECYQSKSYDVIPVLDAERGNIPLLLNVLRWEDAQIARHPALAEYARWNSVACIRGNAIDSLAELAEKGVGVEEALLLLTRFLTKQAWFRDPIDAVKISAVRTAGILLKTASDMPAHREAIGRMAEMLTHEDFTVRTAAAVALGRDAASNERFQDAAVIALLDRMEQGEEEVRGGAAFGLTFAVIPVHLLERLAKGLKDDQEVRENICHAVRTTAQAGKPIAPIMEAMVVEMDEALAEFAASKTRRILYAGEALYTAHQNGEDISAALPVLRRGLSYRDEAVPTGMAMALMRAGDEKDKQICEPILRRLLDSPHAHVRICAAETLVCHTQKAEIRDEALTVLGRALQSEDLRILKRALQAFQYATIHKVDISAAADALQECETALARADIPGADGVAARWMGMEKGIRMLRSEIGGLRGYCTKYAQYRVN